LSLAPHITGGAIRPDGKLRSVMTGYARIQCRQAPLAAVFAEKCLRFIRTEFWW